MTPFFFGPAEQRLYGVYHPPAPALRSPRQVLLCPPFGQEAVRTHLLYRLLAEQLARQGVHVMRFDYLGSGESAGTDTEGSLTRWRDDLLMAHEELGRRTRAQETTWLGCRLGATLAMLASAQGRAAPQRIVLWEPVLDGASHLRELGEAHAQHTFDPFIQRQRPSTELKDEVLGFGVSAEWLRQLQALTVEQVLAACADTCIHIGTQQDELTLQLASRLRARGVAWQHQPTQTRTAWHQEEAGGAALAPPELLRLLASAALGQTA